MESTNHPLKAYALYTCNESRESGSYSVFFVIDNQTPDYKLRLVQQAMFLITSETIETLKSNTTLYTALNKAQSSIFDTNTIDCIFNALRKNHVPCLEISTYGILH